MIAQDVSLPTGDVVAQIVQALLHLIINGLTHFDVHRTKRP